MTAETSQPSEKFRNALRQHGHSLTRARLAVFGALQGKEPLSMPEVVRACAGQADRASVYRAVALFEELGVIKRLQIGWKYKLELGDVFQHHHHHLTCLRCGRVVPLPEDRQLEAGLHTLARSRGFIMKEHVLEIQGLCPDCQT